MEVKIDADELCELRRTAAAQASSCPLDQKGHYAEVKELHEKITDLEATIHAHPTLAETFFEAALATDGEAIHLLVEPEELDPDD